jgi:hypothetical protein
MFLYSCFTNGACQLLASACNTLGKAVPFDADVRGLNNFNYRNLDSSGRNERLLRPHKAFFQNQVQHLQGADGNTQQDWMEFAQNESGLCNFNNWDLGFMGDELFKMPCALQVDTCTKSGLHQHSFSNGEDIVVSIHPAEAIAAACDWTQLAFH